MAKIIGNTTATPNPRPDWAQTDKTKADYIKNKGLVEDAISKKADVSYVDNQFVENQIVYYTPEKIAEKSSGAYMENGNQASALKEVEDGYAWMLSQGMEYWDGSYVQLGLGIKIVDGVVKLKCKRHDSGGMNSGIDGMFLIGELHAKAGKSYVFPKSNTNPESEYANFFVADLDGTNKIARTWVKTADCSYDDGGMSATWKEGYYDSFTVPATEDKTYGIWVDVRTDDFEWRWMTDGSEYEVADFSYFITPITNYATKEYVNNAVANSCSQYEIGIVTITGAPGSSASVGIGDLPDIVPGTMVNITAIIDHSGITMGPPSAVLRIGDNNLASQDVKYCGVPYFDNNFHRTQLTVSQDGTNFWTSFNGASYNGTDTIEGTFIDIGVYDGTGGKTTLTVQYIKRK